MRKPDFDGKCPICQKFKYFKKEWTLAEWLRRLRRTPLRGNKDPGRECSICFKEYYVANHFSRLPKPSRAERATLYATLELSVQLPCQHIFGMQCLKQWLSPKSKGGSGNNTCPMCRRVSAFFEHSLHVLGRVLRD